MRWIFYGAMSFICAGAAFAQDASDKPVWSGEGALGASVNTGNTDTVDVSVGLKLARETKRWKTATEGSFNFGTTDGVETSNRFFVAGQIDRRFDSRLFIFARASYEQDDFSGFESRFFIGTGLGYQVFTGDKTKWSLELAPGFRIDETADMIDLITQEFLVEGSSNETIGVRGASRFSHAFNDAVSLTNNSDVIWSEESTQLTNFTALDAKLTRALTARVSFEVRFDTNPPAGFEDTDTATRVSLVYGF